MLIKGFNSLSYVEKRVQFFELCWKKGSILWVMLKKGFNSLSYVKKRFNSMSHLEKKMFSSMSHLEQKMFSSMSHLEKKMFSSMRHIFSKNLCVIFEKRDVQFCASYSRKEMFNSVSVILKNFNSLSHILKIHSWNHSL